MLGHTHSRRRIRADGWIAALFLSGFLVFSQSSATASAAAGPDLALGRPAVASSVQSSAYPASDAVDSSLSTRWSSSFSDPQRIYVDLGSTYTIHEVVLHWETAYGKAYQLQVSTDAVHWTRVYSTTTGTGGVNDLTGLSGTGRYVRMYGTARGTDYGYSLWDFAVYANYSPNGSPGGTPAATTKAASSVGSTTATLNGSVNPESQATTYSFQYGVTTSYGSTTSTLTAGSGSTTVAHNAAVRNLTAGATYHFRIIAQNASGTSYGNDRTSTTTAGSSGATGFLTTAGTNFMLNGKTIQFIGYNAYGMPGCWNGSSGTAWTNAQLDAYFSSLPANGLTRIWATQTWGTSVIANILNQAAVYGQHVILVLGNDDGNCDPTTDDPSQTGEPLAFYTTNWSSQYVTWVNTIVPLFKSNTTIAMWEIANEPGQYATPTEAQMQTYLSGAAAAIKADDPNHLVESGVNDEQNMGGTQADYQAAQSSTNINVLSFHDYAWDFEAGGTLSGHYTVAQTTATALNKPFIVGEAGVEGCASPSGDYNMNGLPWMSLSQRVTSLTTKANDYFVGTGPAGTGSPSAGAVLFWDYQPTGTPMCTGYGYDIVPGDPMISTVQNYVVP